MKKNNKAFVLLFTLLISSILLATGLGISRLVVRQITLASLGRESQVALFAADSGIECALHWELSGKFDLAEPSEDRTIFCNGLRIADGSQNVITSSSYGAECDALGAPPQNNTINGGSKSCFNFSVSPPGSNPPNNQPCVYVVVDKSNLVAGGTTEITANGYNRCNLDLPNTLQRTLQITLVQE
jgi:hypothetical protein